MTHQRSLNPLTLLFAPLLCYGFVLVWTQTVTHDETTTVEEPRSPQSPALVNVLTGENLSVSVAPETSSYAPPSGVTRSAPIRKKCMDEVMATEPPTAAESATILFPSTAGSAPNVVRGEGGETTECTEATLAESSTPTLGFTAKDSSSMTANDNSVSTSALDNEVSTREASGSTVAGMSARMATSSNRVRKSKNTHMNQNANKMFWRVELQSHLSQQATVSAFFEKACDLVFNKAHMKDTIIIWGPESLEMLCV